MFRRKRVGRWKSAQHCALRRPARARAPPRRRQARRAPGERRRNLERFQEHRQTDFIHAMDVAQRALPSAAHRVISILSKEGDATASVDRYEEASY